MIHEIKVISILEGRREVHSEGLDMTPSEFEAIKRVLSWMKDVSFGSLELNINKNKAGTKMLNINVNHKLPRLYLRE